ncbi:hypothetical protein [Halotia branconii]|uniref:Uncharacterized protein n=1 Tax=Halotia branconii CENA392 TaxID=1539056 RepID=A0AAJ6P921_9CYAN|nr:hypothetical protein [Halotia branconii]WGV25290.1 hypothetical protein QI031_26670 [Halotia branconii CENA392]
MIIGSMLLAIAITACNSSTTSQQPPANTPAIANPLVTSSPTSPPVFLTQNATGDKPLQQQAVQVIRDYYTAINRQDYKQAYSAWEGSGTASKQSFEQFKQGFADTASVAVEVEKPGQLEGAAGSLYIKIPVTVTAITTNGTLQRFHGSYVLRRVNNVPGSTKQQRQWHLHSANITKN